MRDDNIVGTGGDNEANDYDDDYKREDSNAEDDHHNREDVDWLR